MKYLSRSFPIIVLMFLLSACLVDYGVDYVYVIENNTSREIKVYFEVYPDIQATDSVNALTGKVIFTDFGLCEKGYIPSKEDLPFKKIEIYYNASEKIDVDFNNKDLWTFSSKEYEGRYILNLDPGILNKRK